MKQIITKPRITEKSIGETDNSKFTFEIAPRANKIEVAKEIEGKYKVNVANVKIINKKGKPKRFRFHLGKRKDIKKAIVTLKKGQKIPGFEIKEAKNEETKKK